MNSASKQNKIQPVDDWVSWSVLSAEQTASAWLGWILTARKPFYQSSPDVAGYRNWTTLTTPRVVQVEILHVPSSKARSQSCMLTANRSMPQTPSVRHHTVNMLNCDPRNKLEDIVENLNGLTDRNSYGNKTYNLSPGPDSQSGTDTLHNQFRPPDSADRHNGHFAPSNEVCLNSLKYLKISWPLFRFWRSSEQCSSRLLILLVNLGQVDTVRN